MRTVLGDVAPEELGRCDAHEHLLLVSPLLRGHELDDRQAATDDTRALRAAGADAVAEWTPIGLGRDLRDDEITVLEGWAGDLYGIPVQSTIDAITLTGRLEGVILDPVYEGKSMAGLIDLVGSGQIAPTSTVLYAHLGGQPALNAYSGIF